MGADKCIDWVARGSEGFWFAGSVVEACDHRMSFLTGGRGGGGEGMDGEGDEEDSSVDEKGG